jgi:tRNA1(Val) A37 N6-methylase TrmN6
MTDDTLALGPLTDDALTRDFRIFQRAKGHRFSSDDLATAFVAWHARSNATRVLDLGCGIGSVLLHLAWAMPEARFVGVEAQAISFALLEKNIARARVNDRVRVIHGDLREENVVCELGEFDLVTGTPPYFPPGHASDAMDEQRAYARIEYRGGVEAYLATAGRVVSEDGLVVTCGDARASERVVRGAADAKLFIRARCDVIPREHEKALFSVWTLQKNRAHEIKTTSMTLRDAAGERTEDARALRRFSGLEE